MVLLSNKTQLIKMDYRDKISLKQQNENMLLLLGNFEKLPESNHSSEIRILISSCNEGKNISPQFKIIHFLK